MLERTDSQRKRVILLTQSRSGSNFLLDVLNQHPAILNHGELFWQGTYYHKLSKVCELLRIPMYLYVEWIFRSNILLYLKMVRVNSRKNTIRKKELKEIKVVGFKEFFTKFEEYGLFDWLHRNNDIRVIYLYRNNQLDRHISLCNTRMTKKFVVGQDEKYNAKKIELDIPYMLARLNLFAKQKEIEHREIEKYSGPKLYINYEDYFTASESIQSHNKKVFSFLRLDGFSTKIRQKKILPTSLHDKISNYEEVVAALNETEFEKFLPLY